MDEETDEPNDDSAETICRWQKKNANPASKSIGETKVPLGEGEVMDAGAAVAGLLQSEDLNWNQSNQLTPGLLARLV